MQHQQKLCKATLSVLIATIISIVAMMAIPVSFADTLDDDPLSPEIKAVQCGNDAVLSIQGLSSGDNVTWDIGDGRVFYDASIETTITAGLHLIRAVVTSENTTTYLERYIGNYDSTPPMYVDNDGVYRYGTLAKSSTLQVVNENDESTSWLSYDPNKRILHGQPTETGTYTVHFADQVWNIIVTDSDLTLTRDYLDMNVAIEDNRIIATAETSSDITARFSWSLRDLEGNLKSAHEGKNLNISAEPGYYNLKLQQIGISGSSSYSQIVFIDGEIIRDSSDDKSYVLPLILGIITIILLMIATITRNPIVSLSSIITAVIALLMVI